MNLVDSCGWLEYLAGGPNADYFAKPLEDIDHLVVPTICLYEVFKRVLQQQGRSAALEVTAAMRQGKVVALTDSIALQAATLGDSLGLALADSVILATAQSEQAVLWTQDAHFKDIEDVAFVSAKPIR